MIERCTACTPPNHSLDSAHLKLNYVKIDFGRTIIRQRQFSMTTCRSRSQILGTAHLKSNYLSIKSYIF